MARLSPNPERLERFVHALLHDLPPCRAPHTLAARVLAAVEQQAQRPWWRQGFMRWPKAARAAYLTVAVAVAVLVIAPGSLLQVADTMPLADISSHLVWLTTLRNLCSTFVSATGIVGQAIPPFLFYGALALVAAIYAALFGLGVAAYRTFTTTR